jgi:hypothetical protein
MMTVMAAMTVAAAPRMTGMSMRAKATTMPAIPSGVVITPAAKSEELAEEHEQRRDQYQLEQQINAAKHNQRGQNEEQKGRETHRIHMIYLV